MSESDQTATLLGGEPTPAPAETPAAPKSDPMEDLLGSIRREDGSRKYTDVKDALQSIPHKEQMIGTLKGENDLLQRRIQELEAQANKAKTTEEIMAALQPSTPAPQEATPQGLSKEDVLALYNQQKTQESAQANIAVANQFLADKYGEKAADVLSSKLTELNIGKEMAESIAAQTPEAFKQLFGGKDTPAMPEKTQTGINTQGVVTPGNVPNLKLDGLSAREKVSKVAELRRMYNEGNDPLVDTMAAFKLKRG
jgi:hypothetical protein